MLTVLIVSILAILGLFTGLTVLIIVGKAGLDPCSVAGTGYDGLVTRQDAIPARGG